MEYNGIIDGGVKMDALRKEEIYTIDDIYALPDGERAELIDGKIYYMAPPGWKHQRISSYLHNQIYNYMYSVRKIHFCCHIKMDGRK